MKHYSLTFIILILCAAINGPKAQTPCVKYDRISHCTSDREVNRLTHYTQSADQVFFINKANQVSRMEKNIWREYELDLGAPTASADAGIELVSPHQVWYVTSSGKLRYFDYQGGLNWQVSNDVTNLVDMNSDLESNDDFLFFVGGDQKTRSVNLGGLGIQLMNQNAPLAKPGTELLWSESDNRLYYSGGSRLHALEWNGSTWQVLSNVAINIHPFSSHLAANDDHVFYINRYNQVTEMEKSSFSTFIPNTSLNAKAHADSDLIWADDKLFYVSNARHLVYQFPRSLTNWVFCDKFIMDVYPYIHFAEVEKNILFAESETIGEFKTVYFRSPLDPVEILNPVQQECWSIVPELSDEFNNPVLDQTKWVITPGWGQNDPKFFLADDGSAHSLISQSNTRFCRITTSKGCWDQNQNPSGQPCNWEYKSGLLVDTLSSVQPGDKVEIRCRFQKTKLMKYSFWFWSGGQEIDAFEILGHGMSIPTNHHNFITSGGISDPIDVQIVCDRDLADEWVTITIEWDNDEIVWYYNNMPIRRVKVGQPCPEVNLSNYSSGIIISAKVKDTYLCAPNTFPNFFDIDYVRTYRKNENCQRSGLGLVANSNDGVNIYPNPANNIVNVINEGGKISEVQVINLSGQVVMTSKIGTSESEVQLDVERLPAGTYFLRITTDLGIVNKKVTLL